MATGNAQCPNCSTGMTKSTTVNGRLDRCITILINRAPVLRLPLGLINALAGLLTSAPAALKKCGACDNKRTVPDVTNDTKKYAQVASALQVNAQKISELESRMGKGGDEVKICTGDVYLQCGLIPNTAPSYRIDPQSSPTRGAMPDGGDLTSTSKGTIFTKGGKTNSVKGLNPIATPGGEYTIFCTNKFKLQTGARGVEIKTGGPVTIDGGITRITGPQVTVGTSSGRLVLEGEMVNINGTSIEMTPSGKGQVLVNGTLGVASNMIVGGHAHMENVSFVGATCTAKNETTVTASSNDLITGPARWGGVSTKALELALEDLVTLGITTISDPRKILGVLMLRGQGQLLDKMYNILYSIIPLDLNVTGIAFGVGVSLVFNFPHHHATHDGEHSHTMKIPNINLMDDGSGVRAASAGASSNATKSSGMEAIASAFLAFTKNAFPAAYAAMTAFGKRLFAPF